MNTDEANQLVADGAQAVSRLMTLPGGNYPSASDIARTVLNAAGFLDPADHDLALPPCSCDCRQCGLGYHCSECYRKRRRTALDRALGRAVIQERARIRKLAETRGAHVHVDGNTAMPFSALIPLA